MDKRRAGVSFCAISAFLFASQYMTAALYGSGMASQSFSLFHFMLECVGAWLPILGTLSLIIGIMYLLAAEEPIKKIRERLRMQQINDNSQTQ